MLLSDFTTEDLLRELIARIPEWLLLSENGKRQQAKVRNPGHGSGRPVTVIHCIHCRRELTRTAWSRHRLPNSILEFCPSGLFGLVQHLPRYHGRPGNRGRDVAP